MDEQRHDDQLEPTYSSSVLIRDVALKTNRKQWTIGKGGEKGSGISMLRVRHYDEEMYLIDADISKRLANIYLCYEGYKIIQFALFELYSMKLLNKKCVTQVNNGVFHPV